MAEDNDKYRLKEAPPDHKIYKMGYVIGVGSNNESKETEKSEHSMSDTEKWLTEGMAEAAMHQWKK